MDRAVLPPTPPPPALSDPIPWARVTSIHTGFGVASSLSLEWWCWLSVLLANPTLPPPTSYGAPIGSILGRAYRVDHRVPEATLGGDPPSVWDAVCLLFSCRRPSTTRKAGVGPTAGGSPPHPPYLFPSSTLLGLRTASQ